MAVCLGELQVGDNDPARFWRHGVAALDQARPGLAGRVGPLLGPPAPSSYEGLVTALINELAAGRYVKIGRRRLITRQRLE